MNALTVEEFARRVVGQRGVLAVAGLRVPVVVTMVKDASGPQIIAADIDIRTAGEPVQEGSAT
jgi:hypothetical protein